MGGKSSKRDNHEACEACERYYEGTAAASNQGAWHPNYNLYNDGAYWHQGSKENILIHSDPNIKHFFGKINFRIQCMKSNHFFQNVYFLNYPILKVANFKEYHFLTFS